MKAGHELDGLMASEVMEWELLTVGYFGGPDETPRQVELKDWLDKVEIESVGDYYIDVKTNFWIHADDNWQYSWHPSTDIVAAMQVVERVCQSGYWAQMRTPWDAKGEEYHDGYWCGFTPWLTTGWNGMPDYYTSAETLPLAICLSAQAWRIDIDT